MTAALWNFRSFSAMIAPLLWSYSYVYGISIKMPWLMFVSRCVVVAIIPEMIFRTVSEKTRKRLSK